MSKMATNELVFAALKLLEQLYRDGEIPDYVLRNAIMEYIDVVDLSQFNCLADLKMR